MHGNHLRDETSPYLLQHAGNPVDWHPWCEQAFALAREQDRPIFLSIGYAACHWCHVMERESFEDEEIAAALNDRFVSIKVDREERPDVDEIYMSAVQLMTQQGGWPLSVFLTPDLQPFFGGTYFPRQTFVSLLLRVREAWDAQRDEVVRSAARLTDAVRQVSDGPDPGETAGLAGPEVMDAAVVELARRFDPHGGGFGHAPKFPQEGAVDLLLRVHGRGRDKAALPMAEKTLEAMARGGIFDHFGGGFARYSVDERWLVPHFEKMLYNQALLVPLYVDAWLLTRKPLYERVVRQTLDFVRSELTDPDGGFHSSLDADSDGVEGQFYTWRPDELVELLGTEQAGRLCAVYGIDQRGNFDTGSIPNLLEASLAQRAADGGIDESTLDERLAPLRRKMLDHRAGRPRPATDDKVLTSWNGLMIGALARAFEAFGRPEDLSVARRAADFVIDHLVSDGRAQACYARGRARFDGYLDDHAFLGCGLLDLYEATFEPRYLQAADRLALTLMQRFQDTKRGGFFFTADDHEQLLARTRSLHDGALPAGAGRAALLLLRLAVHLDRDDYRTCARRALEAAGPAISRSPSGHASLLLAADFLHGPVAEIAIIGKPDDASTAALLEVVRGRYLPRRAIALAPESSDDRRLALLWGKSCLDGRPTAYLCRNRTCGQPVTDPEGLRRQLDEAGPPPD